MVATGRQTQLGDTKSDMIMERLVKGFSLTPADGKEAVHFEFEWTLARSNVRPLPSISCMCSAFVRFA